MPWLRDKLEVGYHGTHGHQNYCLGLNHMGNGGFDREECLWPVYDSYLAWQR